MSVFLDQLARSLSELVEEVVEAGEGYRRAFSVLDLHALPRHEPCDRAEHRDAVVAVGVDAAAARPCGRAADDEPVRARLDPYADRAEALGHRVDAVGLLRAQLRGATDDRLAVRERAEQRDQ